MTDETADATIATYLIETPGIKEQRERIRVMLKHTWENAYRAGKDHGYASATAIEAQYPPHSEGAA